MSIWAASTFEVSFCLSFFLGGGGVGRVHLGSQPGFKVNKKHPSFQSILHPSCHFTSRGSEMCAPFSLFPKASREFEYTSLSYLYKIPKAEHGAEGWIYLNYRYYQALTII